MAQFYNTETNAYHDASSTLPSGSGWIEVATPRPTGYDELPVVLFFHGGSWRVSELYLYNHQSLVRRESYTLNHDELSRFSPEYLAEELEYASVDNLPAPPWEYVRARLTSGRTQVYLWWNPDKARRPEVTGEYPVGDWDWDETISKVSVSKDIARKVASTIAAGINFVTVDTTADENGVPNSWHKVQSHIPLDVSHEHIVSLALNVQQNESAVPDIKARSVAMFAADGVAILPIISGLRTVRIKNPEALKRLVELVSSKHEALCQARAQIEVDLDTITTLAEYITFYSGLDARIPTHTGTILMPVSPPNYANIVAQLEESPVAQGATVSGYRP